ncbi:MAG: hypothetical protein HY928_01925 [Elusimicrobia bacterium]|nr:hypothetical protein [Elusimicrobiota bacterium]
MRGERGAVLVYVLVASVLMGLVAASAARVAFGGRLLQVRSEKTSRARTLLDGARARVAACLYDPERLGTSCKPTPAQLACLPREAEGRLLTVAFSGPPPACRITITLHEAGVL